MLQRSIVLQMMTFYHIYSIGRSHSCFPRNLLVPEAYQGKYKQCTQGLGIQGPAETLVCVHSILLLHTSAIHSG